MDLLLGGAPWRSASFNRRGCDDDSKPVRWFWYVASGYNNAASSCKGCGKILEQEIAFGHSASSNVSCRLSQFDARETASLSIHPGSPVPPFFLPGTATEDAEAWKSRSVAQSFVTAVCGAASQPTHGWGARPFRIAELPSLPPSSKLAPGSPVDDLDDDFYDTTLR
ncbi:hypothetical protein EKO04_008429 [Ascochyta lentis]|uniref:Uncharacterized protein n=1 Tax=Ascochyta lentis TaxID=205686 RepID=A0A8H7IZC1_9PLEO|nr:hypothetical protein EKO04_008429 [Ascochyta lentis]